MMKFKFFKIADFRSLIIFILCIGLLIGIPFYWFLLVPPALELEEINQSSYSASGYFAPGGYFNLKIDLGKQSIQGYNNGELKIFPNVTDSQNISLWILSDTGVDHWPGSKSEIKYSSNSPINKEMFVIVDKIEIPNNTELKGQTVPINIRYYANYPVQTDQTEILGGTITKFNVNTATFEKNITIKLDNRVISPHDLEVINMNESWKKILSLIIWIVALFILIFFFTDFKIIKDIKTKFKEFIIFLSEKIRI